MKNYTAAAISLGDKAKATARNLGLDVTLFATRHVVDRLATEFPTDLPYFAKGGELFPQHLRETSDLDIVSIRRISNREVQNGFKLLAPKLAREGITIHSISPEPREIIIPGLPNAIDRWKVTATCGTIRADTHIDLTWSNGRDASWINEGPRPKWVERPALIRGAPDVRVRMQHPADAAADRLLAIIMQPASDLRCKYLADVVNGNLWPDDLDCRDVAKALRATMRYRGIPASVAAEHPEAMSWANLSRLEADWNQSRNAQRSGLRFDEAFVDLHALWSDVHAELRAAYASDFRRPSPNTSIVDRIVAAPRPVPTPSYTPKF